MTAPSSGRLQAALGVAAHVERWILPPVKRVLFVCSQNRLRSPTAEQVFASHPQMECASAGTNLSANVPLSVELVEWAEVIFVMEKAHRNKLTKKFKPGGRVNGSNPSIERTVVGKPPTAAHVERLAP